MDSPVLSGADLGAGVAAASVVCAELALAGALCAGSPAAAFNAVAPLILSPEAAEHQRWHPVYTPAGLVITACGITGWAAVTHRLMRRTNVAARPGGIWAAAGTSAAALALFDYHILPPIRRPRFSRWLPASAITAKYAALAALADGFDSEP